MKTHLNIVPLLLLLTGCGGADFASSEAGDTGGSTATGGATGVTGGVTGVTGGSGALGGSGGAQAGTGGALGGSSGAGTGGEQMGTGGALGGSGGAATCTVPVVDDLSPELPTTIVWGSYESHVVSIPTDQCLTCLSSPCATCDATWWPVTQDGRTITAGVAVKCGPVDVSLADCGSTPTASCTTWAAPGLTATLTLELQPKADGTGYTTLYRTLTNGGINSYQGLGGACPSTTYYSAVQANQPMWSLFYALRDTVATAEWPCGG